MKTRKKPKSIARQLISFMFIFMLLLFLLVILVVRQLLFNVMRSSEEMRIGNLTEANVQIIDKQLSDIMTLAKISSQSLMMAFTIRMRLSTIFTIC